MSSKRCARILLTRSSWGKRYDERGKPVIKEKNAFKPEPLSYCCFHICDRRQKGERRRSRRKKRKRRSKAEEQRMEQKGQGIRRKTGDKYGNKETGVRARRGGKREVRGG